MDVDKSLYATYDEAVNEGAPCSQQGRGAIQVSTHLNFRAPNPIQYCELARTLGAMLRHSAVMPSTAFMIRPIKGEFGNVFWPVRGLA